MDIELTRRIGRTTRHMTDAPGAPVGGVSGVPADVTGVYPPAGTERTVPARGGAGGTPADAATRSPATSFPPGAPAAGRKDDHGKARFDLLPSDALAAFAQVVTVGAAKYGDRNWEAGMNWGRMYAAAQRHLNAFWSGEDDDPETGLPHLAHALCCIAFLLSYTLRGVGADTRR